MKKLMIIEADTNDADYIHSIQYVDDNEIEFINSIIPKLINYGSSYKWETQEIGSQYDDYRNILTEDEIERFGDYLPHSEFGIHTIESIKIFDVINETRLA